jgi:AraC family transcriptional regulator of adaptative response / DNA-3-methyladenine glycosylase II
MNAAMAVHAGALRDALRHGCCGNGCPEHRPRGPTLPQSCRWRDRTAWPAPGNRETGRPARRRVAACLRPLVRFPPDNDTAACHAGAVLEDPDRCYEAARSKDSRFDGWFICAVTSTGIYCRPSCPARTARREHMRFYPTAAAAQQAGFRACLRCRPDAAPGSPEWDRRADVVARAMRLIRDGVVDREGVVGLARRLAYSTRQLHRLMTAEVGTGPLALARAQRAQTARILLERTALPVSDVAFAAGFSSVRQCNETMRQIFADTPLGLRRVRPLPAELHRAGSGPEHRDGSGGTPQSIHLRLPCRLPFTASSVLAFLGQRSVAGVERFDGTRYQRSLRLARGQGIVTVWAGPDGSVREGGSVLADLRLSDLHDLTSAVERCRRLLDLDADPVAIAETLGADSHLGPVVGEEPGRRVVGAVDGFELAVRAVIGQQVSVRGGRTVAAKLVAAAGQPLARPDGNTTSLTHLFPTPEALVELAHRKPDAFAMPARRRQALVALSRAVIDGELVIDAGADPGRMRAQLVALPGVGPWTAEYVAMRALRDPDAFMPTDLGVLRAAAALGLPDDPARLDEHSQRWRPWRSYAMAHLWSLPVPSTKGKAA